jgi:hypothetical protein
MPPLQNVAPPGGEAHVPSALPAAMVQIPPQHSGPAEHVSPFCVQNDEAFEHRPATHNCEQQSELCEHALLNVRQVVLRALHAPLTQAALQQSASTAQACLSDAHAAVPPRIGENPPSNVALPLADDPPHPLPAMANASAMANATETHVPTLGRMCASPRQASSPKAIAHAKRPGGAGGEGGRQQRGQWRYRCRDG